MASGSFSLSDKDLLADTHSLNNARSTLNSPPPSYGAALTPSNTLKSWHTMLEGFKRDPHAAVAPDKPVRTYRHTFDVEEAACNTATSPLLRSLKSRHLQMIAIGGSIGMSSSTCLPSHTALFHY